ncbi:MAG: hypothetical protein E7074_00315 [Bacteroidales bacterium]|jgi:hypothetical protein|nr:hypothetical protein [Bacteroidales bacterium]
MKKVFLKSLLLLCALIVGSNVVWGADTYVKVTSSSQLVSGKDYVLVSSDGTKSIGSITLGTGKNVNKDYYGLETVTANNDKSKITDVKSAHVLTLGGEADAWTFYDKTDSKYVSLIIDGNYVNQSASVEGNSQKWTISISNTGVATIASNYKTSRMLQYNASSSRWACYKSSSSQADGVLYVKEDASSLSSIALSGTYPTTFHQGDAFSHEGLVVTANYDDETSKNVTNSASFSGYDMSTTGNQTVTVSYTESDVTKTATYAITVNAPATLASIALSGTYTTTFTQGDAFSHEGLVVTANYDDETSKNVTNSASFSGYDMSTTGNQTVTVSYTESDVTKTATYNITVNAYVQPTEIEIDNWNTLFGTSFDGALGTDDKKDYPGTTENVTVTYKQATNMYIKNEELRIYNGSKLIFEAPTGYAISEIEFTGNIGSGKEPTSNEGTFDSSTKKWSGIAKSVTIYRNSGESYCKFTGATITLTNTAAIVITTAKWASFSCASALDFTGTDVTAYIAKAKNASNVTLTEIKKVPANTGFVVNATAAGTYSIPVFSGVTDDVTGNLLHKQLTAGTPSETTYYTLAVDEGNPVFKKSAGGTLAAGKAYLVPSSGNNAPSIIRVVDEENNATNIESIEASDKAVKFIENGQLLIKRDNVIYDTMGRIIR